MGAITLHPWQVRCPDTDHPDELRIDLDPAARNRFRRGAQSPSTSSNRCSTNSDWWATRRPQAGWACTCSSGSADWDFVDVRHALRSRWPARWNAGFLDLVTTSWWKEERGERIFIDYNQNARDRTFAAAYSVRPTPIATVSTPLTWQELAGADTPTTRWPRCRACWPNGVIRMAGLDAVSQSLEPLLNLAAADADQVICRIRHFSPGSGHVRRVGAVERHSWA